MLQKSKTEAGLMNGIQSTQFISCLLFKFYKINIGCNINCDENMTKEFRIFAIISGVVAVYILLADWLLGCRSCICMVPLTVYPKKYAHGFCFAVLCCGYTLTDFPISIRLTSLALWQSNDCPSASKATLIYMDKYFMWIHYERLHNHNKAKHNKTVCIFLGIYCM